MKREEPSGVLVVDKPRGPTSHDVVARVRRALRTRHVGHAGTLDPMATGVLVIAVGEATKLVPWLTAADKAYEATIRLGIETDTLDADGKEVARAALPAGLAAALAALPAAAAVLEEALAVERARATQVPPAYSAIRVEGARAHELARAGLLEAALPPRPVAVRTLEAVGGRVVELPGADPDVELTVRVEASKGYFVRSLARDLAASLGTLGHLTALRRLRSGAFTIADAVAADAVGPDALFSVADAAARALPVSVLADAGVRAVLYGQRVAPEHIVDPHRTPSAWLDASRTLVAVGECEADGSGRVLRGFPARER
jgi:tRNA pseudouridine55 synthase